jgi:hypothetical protein
MTTAEQDQAWLNTNRIVNLASRLIREKLTTYLSGQQFTPKCLPTANLLISQVLKHLLAIGLYKNPPFTVELIHNEGEQVLELHWKIKKHELCVEYSRYRIDRLSTVG